MTISELAEVIHNARWPADWQMAVTPFADEDRNGREYCFRIARAVEAAIASASPPEQPADPLSDLIAGFAKALLAKLRLASANGRSGWERDDWEKQCQQGLLRHLQKGDPRDVAAYCAFMWHHDWITAPPEQPAALPLAVRLRDEAGPPLPQMIAQRRAQLSVAAADKEHADLLRRLAAVPDKEK